MFLRKIVFFLIAKLVFVQATYSDGQGDHQDLDLKFEPNMTSEDLLNYCYSHSTFCRIKHILRQTLRFNYSQNSEDTVRVLQWNILSQVLGLREFGNASSCPTEALLWVNRRCQILYEILAFKSDVMCFQEVDHFDFLSRALATQSYSGVFVPTTCSSCVKRDGNNGPDGCAILYSNHKYELLGKHELVYIHSAKDSISRQVALLVVLRNKSSLNKLCVATTHLKPLRGEYNEFLRNQQGEELLKFVTEHASDCPTVISGDFNAEPTEPVYRTMISDPQLNLNSAYTASNKEAKFTVWKVKKGRQARRLCLIMDSTNEQADKLINHVHIVITEAEKRMNSTLSLKEYYTVYIIETKVDNQEWAKPKELQKLSLATRRYTDFITLHNHLEQKYPWVVVPPLPEKKQSFMWKRDAVSDNMDPDFVDRRRAGLESFLRRLAGHAELGFDESFIQFLGEKENWTDTARPLNGILKDTEHTIKNMNVSIRNRTSDDRFEAIKSYSNKLQNSVNKVLSCRAKRAERLYNVDMLHAHYGRIFSELSAVDNDIGDAVQRTGHYMDSIASAISPALEDEEIIMDQLKEYLAFTNSLQTFTKNHDSMHYNLDQLNNLSNSKETSGIMSRLFGYTSSVAGRDAAAIEALENRRIEARTAYGEFVSKSLENYKTFERQKDEDLMKILKDYVAFQTKYAQKGLQTWKNILHSIQSID